MTCPCGLGPDLAACCGRFLSGDAVPDTCEALMRSRYTAYTQYAIDYLFATSAKPVRETFSKRDAMAFARAASFQTLEVMKTEAGGPDDDTGVVDFAATYVEAGKTHVLRERSTFGREDGAWRYTGGTKGDATVRRETPKVGRNDPCPCGSGKKFKKCCG